MAEIKLFFADCAGVPSNCSYPHEAVITDEALLRRAVSHDYVCVAYRNGYRTNSNFMNTTCMGMDCDNDHSDNPADWITPEHIRRHFPDVTFAIHFSRNNMKEKRGKAARPKFHVLFLIDEMTDHTAYSDLKKRVNAVFPYFDTRALDSARFFFGTKEPEVAFYPGSITLNECMELYYPESTEDAFWDLDSNFSGTIPEGSRNSTMSHFAGRVLKRFGDTEEAYTAFMERAARCEPPLEDVELMTIWRSAQGFYQRVSAQDDYIPPEQWNVEHSGRFNYDPDDRTDVGQARLLGKHFSQELRYGCVKTRVKDRSWTHWYFLPFIDYGAASNMQPPQTEYALGSRLLTKGTEGNDVKQLQEHLLKLGYSLPKYGADGDFGSETEAAVRAFQKAEGLEVDGKYGEKSHAALMDALSADDEAPEPPAQPEDGGEENDAEKPVGSQVVIVSEGGKVNIRVGNGTQYGRITQLAPGTTLDYVATAQNGWNAVVVNARVGWVSGEYSKLI